MAQVTLSSTVSHIRNPVAADVAGETVLMSLERSRCYGLGAIGSDIWKRIASPVSVTDLIAELNERYDAASGVLERDILVYLTRLAEEGLIEVS